MIWSYWASRLGGEGTSTNQESGLRICPDVFAYNNACWHALAHTHMALTPAASFSSWSASWCHRLPCCCSSGRLGWASAQRCPSGSTTFLPISSIYPGTSWWGDSFPSTVSPATSPRGRCRTTSAAKRKGLTGIGHSIVTDAEHNRFLFFLVTQCQRLRTGYGPCDEVRRGWGERKPNSAAGRQVGLRNPRHLSAVCCYCEANHIVPHREPWQSASGGV